MTFYILRDPGIVRAFTFDDIIDYGVKSGANIVEGMPWSFKFDGIPVTHENDNTYIILGGKIYKTVNFSLS